MRLALILAILPCPAFAWDFSPVPVCTLTHQTDAAEITVTFDPSLPEYALFITLRRGTWAPSPAFGITFDGPLPLSIGTTRHTLSSDGTTLTVRDRGFGNVLDGIELNTSLTARAGDTTVTAPTASAAPAVQAFRACPADSPALS